MNDKIKTSAEHCDPMSGEPGAHPVGTDVGAAIGGVIAGAAAGSVAGPAGTVAGAAIGAVLGGLAGKGVAESMDPTQEDAYWRDNCKTRPYVENAADYDTDYAPAYRHGVIALSVYPGRTFDEIEDDLARDWDKACGRSKLSWDSARPASRDAWQRIDDETRRRRPHDVR